MVKQPRRFVIVGWVLDVLGGPDQASTFLCEHQSLGLLAADEMQHGDAFRGFREAVQGAYFAERLATNRLTSRRCIEREGP